MPEDFWIILMIGFAAQMVDGALGMAYGLTASSFLLASGLPPVQVSATVHLAETVTTGASAVSHHRFGNVDRELFKRLVIPGVLGAAIGAYLLSSLPADKLKPWIAGYILIMGVIVFSKAFTQVPPMRVASKVRSLGFFGAFIDAIGGGGWGPIVASTLLARGNEARFTVGTVNAVEFFVTLSSSIVFLITVGLGLWKIVLPLALGGLIAAPVAAYACKRVPHKPMLAIVGLVIIGVAARTLIKHFA
jgi:uncharacterized membrane protein YfcA